MHNDPTFLSVPPPPAPRRRVRPWMLAAGSILLVCCIAGIILAELGSHDTPQATPTTVARATRAATSTPHPTSTPTQTGPHILTGATLGGLQEAFQAKYGTPTGTGTAKSYSFTINGKTGLVTATPFSTPVSSDGKFHVASLRIGPPAATWTTATAQPICETFMPPDAVFVKTQNVAGYGPERIYTSAALALSFNAAEFTDSSTDQPVAPGTFAMELWPGVAFNTGCIMIIGE